MRKLIPLAATNVLRCKIWSLLLMLIVFIEIYVKWAFRFVNILLHSFFIASTTRNISEIQLDFRFIYQMPSFMCAFCLGVMSSARITSCECSSFFIVELFTIAIFSEFFVEFNIFLEFFVPRAVSCVRFFMLAAASKSSEVHSEGLLCRLE